MKNYVASAILDTCKVKPVPDIFQDMIETDLKKLEEKERRHKVKSNLTRKEEVEAMESIEANSDLVVRTADKGCLVVVLNGTLYKKLNLEILQDITTYRNFQKILLNYF